MKTASSDLIHKINNQFGLLISSIEAMESNIEDTEYCKEVIQEIKIQKTQFSSTIEDLKQILGGIQ